MLNLKLFALYAFDFKRTIEVIIKNTHIKRLEAAMICINTSQIKIKIIDKHP